MEYPNTNQSLFDLQYNENFKSQLRGAAVWGGIAAILSIGSTLLGLIQTFMTKNEIPAEFRAEGFENSTMRNVATGGNIVGTVISLIISILLFYFLIRFSSLTKTGLNGNNPEMVSSGLGNLSSYFITIGVIIIIVLVIFLIAIAGIAASAGS
ncbi:MAG: hypothetical protein JNN00_07250 [Chitinophagaceae bacterium]|nr:hypothetical protein [Chitinophagaceae bacterium]